MSCLFRPFRPSRREAGKEAGESTVTKTRTRDVEVQTEISFVHNLPPYPPPEGLGGGWWLYLGRRLARLIWSGDGLACGSVWSPYPNIARVVFSDTQDDLRAPFFDSGSTRSSHVSTWPYWPAHFGVSQALEGGADQDHASPHSFTCREKHLFDYRRFRVSSVGVSWLKW